MAAPPPRRRNDGILSDPIDLDGPRNRIGKGRRGECAKHDGRVGRTVFRLELAYSLDVAGIGDDHGVALQGVEQFNESSLSDCISSPWPRHAADVQYIALN